METINVTNTFANVVCDVKALVQGFSLDVVKVLAAKYNFDATEAIRALNLEDVASIAVATKPKRGRKTNAVKAAATEDRTQDIIADMINNATDDITPEQKVRKAEEKKAKEDAKHEAAVLKELAKQEREAKKTQSPEEKEAENVRKDAEKEAWVVRITEEKAEAALMKELAKQEREAKKAEKETKKAEKETKKAAEPAPAPVAVVEPVEEVKPAEEVKPVEEVKKTKVKKVMKVSEDKAAAEKAKKEAEEKAAAEAKAAKEAEEAKAAKEVEKKAKLASGELQPEDLSEEELDSEVEEEEEEEIEVKVFVHKMTKYLIDEKSGKVYDAKTQSLVGIYNKAKDIIEKKNIFDNDEEN